MPSIRRASVTLLAALAGTPGCRDSTGTATSPSQSPSPSSAFSLSGKVIKRPQPLAITLTGQVTDATTAGAIAGAIVSINGRYRGATDNAGPFSVAGLLDYGDNHDFTYVSVDNYASDYRYIRGAIQTVRLHRLERILPGESTQVTVAPDDTLCVNNVQDSPGLGPDFVCRSVVVMAPKDGAVTIEAVSTQDGHHPPLEVETRGLPSCCSERIANPTTIKFAAGTMIVVNVEMPASSAGPESFVVHTISVR